MAVTKELLQMDLYALLGIEEKAADKEIGCPSLYAHRECVEYLSASGCRESRVPCSCLFPQPLDICSGEIEHLAGSGPSSCAGRQWLAPCMALASSIANLPGG
ncbi:DNAJC17 isoform 4 [Pongo abelii]|uniref:DNAJC17 isoform 4 n=1 Tax=Pongo abelii TaxID=9601 RepID=A0A2J8S628_PONAB|nr:DNAJC17 isoform 4 [Pongo abelii]